MLSEVIIELENVIFNSNLKNLMKPLFYNYFKSSISNREGIRSYFMENAVIFKLLNAKEKKILEIGCGFGLRLICMALLGTKKAVGIDISEEMFEGFQELNRRFPRLDIEAKKGDFLLTDYPSSSFDVVLLVEAISHIRDTQLLLEKVWDVLSPGGLLFISDSNNDLFLSSRIRARKDWRKAENGPIDENIAKNGRVVDRLCFSDARVEIIKENYPSLDAGTIKLIAKKTQGLWGEEIRKATEEFINTGKISIKSSFPYRNPYTGEFPELGFNPFKLINHLRKKGFRCRFVPPIWAYVGIANITRWKGYVISLLSPILRISPQILLPFCSPSFLLIAKKESR